jgi:O-antigen ligase
MVFCMQRSVWLAALIATVATGLVLSGLRRYLGALLLAAAVIAGAAYAISPSGEFSDRLNQQDTLWQREDLNTAAINMIEARPLFGSGWGTFAEASLAGDFYEQAPDHPLQGFGFQVHNEFLSHGAELGLVGLTLWLGCVLAAIGWVLASPTPAPDHRIWKALFLAYAIFYLVVSNFVPPQFFPNLMFWLLAGVAASGRIWPSPVTTTREVSWFLAPPSELRALKGGR